MTDRRRRRIAIELRGIVKRFPGVVANDGVDLTVRAGTVHAIVGENGAGKSTLMKTLYGAHRPDEGTILVNGVERQFHSPRDAIDAGIGMVFQHFMLADNFTVWENVVLGDEPGTAVRLDIGKARKQIGDLSAAASASTSPPTSSSPTSAWASGSGSRSSRCSTGALASSSSTSRPRCSCPRRWTSCSPRCGSLIARGVDGHLHLPQARRGAGVADAITVIRAGRTVAEIDDAASVTARQLAELMVGSELPTPETRESTVTDQVVLAVDGLTVAGPRAAGPSSRTSRSASIGARSSASPAWRATARPS